MSWRIIKTGLAVGLSVALAQLFHLDYPFFSGFAAVYAMQSTVEGSLKEGLHRMQGTVVGAVMGFLFSLVVVGNPWWTAFGLIITLLLLKALKWPESMVIASMVFIVILIDTRGDSRLLYAINRTADTGLGIVVAYLVNRFVAPPRHSPAPAPASAPAPTEEPLPLSLPETQDEEPAPAITDTDTHKDKDENTDIGTEATPHEQILNPDTKSRR